MSVVRTLAALEAAPGVCLLNRTTRGIALTDEGREYHEHCKHVLAEVDEAEAMLTARHAAPRGRLRVIASVTPGRLHVAPILRAATITQRARLHRIGILRLRSRLRG